MSDQDGKWSTDGREFSVAFTFPADTSTRIVALRDHARKTDPTRAEAEIVAMAIAAGLDMMEARTLKPGDKQ